MRGVTGCGCDCGVFRGCCVRVVREGVLDLCRRWRLNLEVT